MSILSDITGFLGGEAGGALGKGIQLPGGQTLTPGSPTPVIPSGVANAESKAGSTAGKALGGAGGQGLSDLLGVTGIGELLVRGLEALAGAALILLGLQALTGGSGDPVDAVKSAGGKVAGAAAVVK